MQTNTIRVIAAVVDTHNLTLYKTDGETVVIPQGDTRIRPILDIVTPQLIKQGFADVYLAEINSPSDYAKFEEASSGAVKLFRIAKSKLKGWFGKKEDTHRAVTDVVLGLGSPKERIQKLLTIGLTSVGVAKAVLELKKKSKKSWTVLGVSVAQIDQITKLAQ